MEAGAADLKPRDDPASLTCLRDRHPPGPSIDLLPLEPKILSHLDVRDLVLACPLVNPLAVDLEVLGDLLRRQERSILRYLGLPAATSAEIR